MSAAGQAFEGADAQRWGVCFVVVGALHALPLLIVGWWLAPVVSATAPAPSAIMVDMAPLPASPAVMPTEIPPGPKQQRVETPKPPEPEHRPKLPTVERAAVSLPSAEQTPPQPEDKTSVQNTTAPPAVAAPPAPASAPASAAPAPSNGVRTWQGQLLARLEQFKRYPYSAQSRRQQGVAWLRFTIDRDGKVLTARLERSSGFDVLDQETLALIQRAQPLPKPPADVPGNPIELVVPIEFYLTTRR